MMSEPLSFDWAIAPETPERFFADHFEKAPMRVERGEPDYFTELLSYAEIDRVISTMGLGHPEINVTRSDADIAPADFTTDRGQIDPVRVNQLFADGATIILAGLQDRLPQLARYCRAVEAVMSARVQANIYMTPPGNMGLHPHYDSHDVLVLQIAGSKEWRIYGTPVELPLPDQGFERGMDVGEEVDRFVLHPGDTLYVPRGLAHVAVATDETSLHITTGLMVRTWTDVLIEAVIAKAHRVPEMRRALPPGFANHGADLGTYDRTLKHLVGQLEDAPLDKLLHRFREDFVTGRAPRIEGQMAQLAALDTLGMGARVGAVPHLIFTIQPDAVTDQIRLSCQGAEIVMPAFAASAVEFCVTTPDFIISDMAGDLDDAGKLVLAKRMIREGLLRIL